MRSSRVYNATPAQMHRKPDSSIMIAIVIDTTRLYALRRGLTPHLAVKTTHPSSCVKVAQRRGRG
jgi:hypothetical protein